jgi:hypothetical protein
MKIRHQPRRVPVCELPSLAAASCRIGLFARSVRLNRGFRDLPSCFSGVVAYTNRPHPLLASSAHAQRSANKSVSIAFVRKELAVTLIMAALPSTTSTRTIIDDASVVGGTQVVEDVVEIDLAQVRGQPGGQRLPLENIQRPQAKLEHPIGFLLVS